MSEGLRMFWQDEFFSPKQFRNPFHGGVIQAVFNDGLQYHDYTKHI